MIRTLIIDNFDSYTFNLCQLLAEVNGGELEVPRNRPRMLNWPPTSALPACSDPHGTPQR